MGKKTRRRFSSKDKAKAVRSHLIDNKKVSDVADEMGIHPNQYYKWQSDLFENADSAFTKTSDAHEKKLLARIAELEAKLSKKDEVISELASEHIAFKKSIGEL